MATTGSSAEISILVVDDEKALCAFLEEALGGSYRIATCHTGQAAMSLLNNGAFDIVIADLRLPDASGLDILRLAKEKDEFIEVIMITGYASLDSAARAINLGASSYLIKPLEMEELTRQINRAAASRAFHLKSLRLLQQNGKLPSDVKNHLCDITTLYHFSRKMMISLELPDLFQVILQDTNERTNALACAIGIGFLEFGDIFFMPHHGAVEASAARNLLDSVWNSCFAFIDQGSLSRGETKLTLLEGKKGQPPKLTNASAVHLPMIVKGKTIGGLVIFSATSQALSESDYQFLHVYTTLVSTIVEHAYADLQTQLLAKTDSLTGIANHRLFRESIEREISRANRKKTVFGLVMIDIDDFKKINDSHGHLIGDKVLKDLTRRITGIIRRGDLLARYGGEEFALILPDTDLNGSCLLAERIRAEVAKCPFTLIETKIPYTLSLGVAAYDGNNPQAVDALIAAADGALYASKSRGKNAVSTARNTAA